MAVAVASAAVAAEDAKASVVAVLCLDRQVHPFGVSVISFRHVPHRLAHLPPLLPQRVKHAARDAVRQASTQGLLRNSPTRPPLPPFHLTQTFPFYQMSVPRHHIGSVNPNQWRADELLSAKS